MEIGIAAWAMRTPPSPTPTQQYAVAAELATGKEEEKPPRRTQVGAFLKSLGIFSKGLFLVF
jgi:hypothetical protein